MSARRPRVARVAALILLGLLLGGACGAAGVWQWHRFGQKKSADDELRAAARQPVAPLDEVLAPGRPVDDTIRFRTVTATGRSGERVTSSPAGISVAVGSTGSAPFANQTAITLSASNGRDAIWSGACSSGGNKRRTCTFTITGDAAVTANVR